MKREEKYPSIPSGEKFGSWIILRKVISKDNKNRWYECLCTNCNKTKEVVFYSIKNGRSKSCGCVTNMVDIQRKLGEENRKIIKKMLKKRYTQRDILANVRTSTRMIKEVREEIIEENLCK
jgi:hypothetical protein